MRVIVAGGGPAGSIAAERLSSAGIRTILFERSLTGDKTCAGGIPSALVNEFSIPDDIIHQKCRNVRFYGPSGVMTEVTFPHEGYLATIRRLEFDSFLRERAISRGVILEEKEVTGFDLMPDGVKVHYKDNANRPFWAKADYLIGADGAVSRIARNLHSSRLSYVATLQENIIPSSEKMAHFSNVAELYHSTKVSPDYYGWVFPHRDYVTIGVGMSYEHAKNIKLHLDNLKNLNSEWLSGGEIIGRGAAPIPCTHFDDPAKGRVFLVGDAAGFVLPASGEGIYYAMKSAGFAADAIISILRERHTNPELIYNRKCELEFKSAFKYFARIEKLAFKNDLMREIFVRYAAYPGAPDNFLNLFSLKTKVKRSGLMKQIRMIATLHKIRNEIKREGLRF